MLAYTEIVRQLFSAFLIEQLPSGSQGNVPGRADQGLEIASGEFSDCLKACILH